MHTETVCTTLPNLNPVKAIRAIHQAYLQLVALNEASIGQPATGHFDNQPSIKALAECLHDAGHPAFAEARIPNRDYILQRILTHCAKHSSPISGRGTTSLPILAVALNSSVAALQAPVDLLVAAHVFDYITDLIICWDKESLAYDIPRVFAPSKKPAQAQPPATGGTHACSAGQGWLG